MYERTFTNWMENLRSGEFDQGQGQLCTVDRLGDQTFCCLGVLMQTQIDWENLDVDEDQANYDRRAGYISLVISERYLLDHPNHQAQMQIAKLNDDGLSFDQIADCLEYAYISKSGGFLNNMDLGDNNATC